MTGTDADAVPPRDETAAPEAAGVATPPRRAGALQKQREIGGPPGPEPTRYGDWEIKGRCSDF